jgi:putative cardiolipin synthase
MAGALIEESLMVVDNPDLAPGDRPDDIAEQLTEIALAAEKSVLIVSPYLVLTPTLLEIGRTLSEKGVKVEVVTNSLASNDVVIAHAAYARYRQTVLDTGVDLYEFRGDPGLAEGVYPDSDYSLHSKYIIFDDDIVFIGSLNLDPRSLYLNTELGIVLRSPDLASELKESFQVFTDPANAWRVTETEDGLRWTSDAGTLDSQPAKSSWQDFRSKLLMLLPVSSQL